MGSPIAWRHAPPPLIPNQVHVWIVENVSSLSCLPFLFTILTAEEECLAEKRLSVLDQHLAKASRGLLRLLLGRYLSMDPSTLIFHYSGYGKPSLAAPVAHLAFNVSHSGDAVVYAVAIHGTVGIDIESTRIIADADTIIEQFFSIADQKRFRDLDPIVRPGKFLTWWTRKEALFKAIGKGLSIAMDAFDVGAEADECAFSLGPEWGFDASLQLRVMDLDLPKGLTGSVAVVSDANITLGALSCIPQGDLLFAY